MNTQRYDQLGLPSVERPTRTRSSRGRHGLDDLEEERISGFGTDHYNGPGTWPSSYSTLPADRDQAGRRLTGYVVQAGWLLRQVDGHFLVSHMSPVGACYRQQGAAVLRTRQPGRLRHYPRYSSRPSGRRKTDQVPAAETVTARRYSLSPGGIEGATAAPLWLSGAELLEFVSSRMAMSSYYQPLVIRSLIEAGGRQPARELAIQLLNEDQFAVARAQRTLMRWPYLTLRKHGVVGYDKPRHEFVLQVRFDSEEQRHQVLARCAAEIDAWRQRELPKIASRFFGVIERAGGRCEACGVPGSIRPIDVDHIIPRSRAFRRRVTLPDGSRVPVDDERNLQALCSRCNRGKRDASAYDFRPSAERLRETIVLAFQKARSQGYDWEEILAAAQAELKQPGEAHAVSAPPAAGPAGQAQQ